MNKTTFLMAAVLAVATLLAAGLAIPLGDVQGSTVPQQTQANQCGSSSHSSSSGPTSSGPTEAGEDGVEQETSNEVVNCDSNGINEFNAASSP
jgi:hypothetical protein